MNSEWGGIADAANLKDSRAKTWLIKCIVEPKRDRLEYIPSLKIETFQIWNEVNLGQPRYPSNRILLIIHNKRARRLLRQRSCSTAPPPPPSILRKYYRFSPQRFHARAPRVASLQHNGRVFFLFFFFFGLFISKKILNWYRNDKVNSPDKGARGCIAVVQRVYDKTGGRGRERIYRRNRWKLIGHCARPPHRKLGLINLAFCNQSSFCCKLLRQQRALTLRKGQMNCWYNAEILFDSLCRWNKRVEKN